MLPSSRGRLGAHRLGAWRVAGGALAHQWLHLPTRYQPGSGFLVGRTLYMACLHMLPSWSFCSIFEPLCIYTPVTQSLLLLLGTLPPLQLRIHRASPFPIIPSMSDNLPPLR